MDAPARGAGRLAWSLWLVSMACCAGGLTAAALWVRPFTLGLFVQGAVAALAFPVGYATIGLVLGLRRPANPIGWLYAASGVLWAAAIPWQPWVGQLIREQRPVTLAVQITAMAWELIWAPAIALGVIVPFLLLPDGRLRSPRWRAVVYAVVTGVALFVVGGLLSGSQTSETPVPVANPLVVTGLPAAVARALAPVGLLLYAVSMAAALLCVLLRFRAARGVERQQLRWVLAGAAVAVLVLLPLPELNRLSDVTGIGVLSVPAAVAVAVLRYRLWDLDRLISRTLAYALITALVAVPYLLIVPLVTRVAARAGSLAVAVATIVAALLFQAVRRPVQLLVDRRCYDAARTGEAFATWLRGQVDVDAVGAGLMAVVVRTLAPATASVWLRRPHHP